MKYYIWIVSMYIKFLNSWSKEIKFNKRVDWWLHKSGIIIRTRIRIEFNRSWNYIVGDYGNNQQASCENWAIKTIKTIKVCFYFIKIWYDK